MTVSVSIDREQSSSSQTCSVKVDKSTLMASCGTFHQICQFAVLLRFCGSLCFGSSKRLASINQHRVCWWNTVEVCSKVLRNDPPTSSLDFVGQAKVTCAMRV